MRIIRGTILVLALAWCWAEARDVSISVAITPEVVAVGDEARMEVKIEGKFRKSSEPLVPSVDGLDIYQSGSSQSISIINGSISSSLTYSYVVVPQREGSYAIGPITYRVGNREYRADPVKLEVVATRARPPAQTGPAAPEEKRLAGRRGNVFITASVDHDTVYVNQQVTWTLRLYLAQGVDLLQSPSFIAPEAEGFWSEDLPPQRRYYKTIKGKRFLVNEVKRAYFASAPGKYTIGPARIEMVVDNLRMPSWDDFFNRPFGTFGFGEPVRLATESRRIVVLPVPEQGRTRDFSGFVGKELRLKVQTDKQEIEVGEPVTLTMTVEGEGNIKTMTAPTMRGLEGFKVYESGSSSEISKKGYHLSGRKRYEFVLVPKSEGEKTLPAVRLSYFDPEAERYRLVASSPILLRVKPSQHEGGRKVVIAGGGEEIEVLGKDIRFIHPAPAVIRANRRSFLGSKVYFSLHALPLLAVVLTLVAERRRKRFTADAAWGRAVRAAGQAEKGLKEAKKLFDKGKREEAFAALASALTNYFADKMNTSAAGLTLPAIEDFLRGRGVGEGMMAKVKRLLGMCDVVRFAPGMADDSAGAQAFSNATALIREMERRLRR